MVSKNNSHCQWRTPSVDSKSTNYWRKRAHTTCVVSPWNIIEIQNDDSLIFSPRNLDKGIFLSLTIYHVFGLYFDVKNAQKMDHYNDLASSVSIEEFKKPVIKWNKRIFGKFKFYKVMLEKFASNKLFDIKYIKLYIANKIDFQCFIKLFKLMSN